MLFRFRSHAIIKALAVSLILFSTWPTRAQAALDLGDAEGDPVKLFQRGQDEQERRDFEAAIKFYDEALKLKPEFPEAEYQRGTALASLGRAAEADKAFRRTIELRPDWALPHLTLGSQLLLARQAAEGEKLLSRALELEPRTSTALVALASNLRWQGQTHRDSLAALLRLLLRVTEDKTATTLHWMARGWSEAALGDKGAALASFQRALSLDSQNHKALMARAQLRADAGEYESAIADMQSARRLLPDDAAIKLQSIHIYVQAGKQPEARREWETLDDATKARPEAAALMGALLSCDETEENRAALEKALAARPRDAQLLACLGAAYRRADPSRSLEFYRSAADIEPKNPDPAVGYLSALVQARRFAEAAVIARRVLQVAPERYEVHANLATALYELKRYPEALVEFRWLSEAKPDLAATYFFIATAHDYLGEYAAALRAYEGFLSRADAQSNQLEIEKVNLRLPSLRNQLKRGEGVKQKKGK